MKMPMGYGEDFEYPSICLGLHFFPLYTYLLEFFFYYVDIMLYVLF